MVEGYFFGLFFLFLVFFGGRLFAVSAEGCIQVNWVIGNILICLFLATTSVPVSAIDSQTVRHHCIYHFVLPG